MTWNQLEKVGNALKAAPEIVAQYLYGTPSYHRIHTAAKLELLHIGTGYKVIDVIGRKDRRATKGLVRFLISREHIRGHCQYEQHN